MAVREFTDREGRDWRAWEINPDAIHPGTKDEVYLAELFQIGWLVFETFSGSDKRRLSPYPRAWATLSDADLVSLVERAEVVPPRKLARQRQSGGEREPGLPAPADASIRDASIRAERPDVTDMGVVRSFRYPGGRIWTVCVIEHPEDGGPPRLQFSAGARVIELPAWPKDWADYPDERLVDLLRRAAPRPPAPPPGPDAPRRRWTDPPRTGA